MKKKRKINHMLTEGYTCVTGSLTWRKGKEDKVKKMRN